MAHFQEEFIHFDGVLYKSRDIRKRKTTIKWWNKGKEVRGKIRDEYRETRVGNANEPENVLFTCENQDVAQAREVYDKYFDDAPDLQIVILRSYYNVMASRFKRYEYIADIGKGWFKTDKPIRDIWCNHARQLLLTSPWYVIKYDGWCELEVYRRRIEVDLKLEYEIDGDMDFIPLNANGSSFDGRKGQSGLELAKKSKSRYLQVVMPRDIFKDEDCAVLNDKIFGWRL